MWYINYIFTHCIITRNAYTKVLCLYTSYENKNKLNNYVQIIKLLLLIDMTTFCVGIAQILVLTSAAH